ncbi:hypothetical protein IJF86_03240 [Candidatus Saccharibacteria bacterium]|nr:hypothetical protein [Candidatus Saccharibacteria bacterium]
MSKAKTALCILGVAAVLFGAVIPLSSTTAKNAIERGEISVGIGIAKYIGIDSVTNTPGTNVDFSDSIYSKNMVNGESIENFGTTTFKIICNFDTNTDVTYHSGYNCKDNGWALSISPTSTQTQGGVSYAAMVAAEHAATILSKSNSFSANDSNWAIKVSPVTKSISGTDVSPTITSGFSSFHIIPATSTEIASGKSWKTIGGVSTYINEFGVSVQYGVGVGSTQAAGTYTGVVNYTLSLKAST